MRNQIDRHCLLCSNAEIPKDGVLICANETRVLHARHARSDSGDCGPEGVLFRKKSDEARYVEQS